MKQCMWHIQREKMHTVFLCEGLMNGHLKDLCIASRTTSKHILEIKGGQA